VEKLRVLDLPVTAAAGTVLPSPKETLYVQAAEGAVALEVVQPAGKTSMPIAVFLRGRPIAPGEKLF
jgi:methionyl-tRNA formyltransferase